MSFFDKINVAHFTSANFLSNLDVWQQLKWLIFFFFILFTDLEEYVIITELRMKDKLFKMVSLLLLFSYHLHFTAWFCVFQVIYIFFPSETPGVLKRVPLFLLLLEKIFDFNYVCRFKEKSC